MFPFRHREVVRPRWAVMYVSRRLTSKSLVEIGKHLNGMDHTSILNGVKRLTALIATDHELAASVVSVEAVATKFAAGRTERDWLHVQHAKDGLISWPRFIAAGNKV